MQTHHSIRVNVVAHWIGKLFMRLSRWHVAGALPPSRKLIVIAAPHTTNWDFVFLLGAAYVFRLKIHWLGKHMLFTPPFGFIMKWLGGIPVDRSHTTNMVQQLKMRFDEASQLAIVIPPAGTRRSTQYWKSGFYWTAFEARATVVCGYLDYNKKIAGLGLSFIPTGNVKEDMDAVRKFYEGIEGKYPELASAIRLKEED